jgi:hypothetical protein
MATQYIYDQVTPELIDKMESTIRKCAKTAGEVRQLLTITSFLQVNIDDIDKLHLTCDENKTVIQCEQPIKADGKIIKDVNIFTLDWAQMK